MATAKRKSSAKRSVKTAAKTVRKVQSKAASATASVAKSAAHQQNAFARNGAEWAQQGANEWQKGANEWAKQSANMYKLPFANGDVNEAGKQAAATMKSATDNMMRASTEMMQKMFGGQDALAQIGSMFGQGGNNPLSQMTSMFTQGNSNPLSQVGKMFGQGGNNPFAQMPGAEAATDKLRSFARESTEQLNKSAAGAQQAIQEAAALSRENAEAAVECSNIAVAVTKELSAELIAYANKSFSQNVELSKQLLTCRTLNDLFDLSSKFAKTNLDGFFSESVKMSEMLFQCATDVSEPLNERMSETSERLTKALAA